MSLELELQIGFSKLNKQEWTNHENRNIIFFKVKPSQIKFVVLMVRN